MIDLMKRVIYLLWYRFEFLFFLIAISILVTATAVNVLWGSGSLLLLVSTCGFLGWVGGFLQGRIITKVVRREKHMIQIFATAFVLNAVLLGMGGGFFFLVKI